MNANKKALFILFLLVSTSVLIFCAEQKFLVAEKRGSALSRYEKIPWASRILLLVDDFEDMHEDKDLEKEKLFTYGSVRFSLNSDRIDKSAMAGTSCLKVSWKPGETYGGWGKGVGENIDLNTETDFLNFRIFIPKSNGESEFLKVIIEEDDNDDGKLQKDKDDQWAATVTLPATDSWQIVSIPLKEFADENEGGDHILNVTRKGGLHTVIFSLLQPDKYTAEHAWYFDFVFFSSEHIDDKQTNNTFN
jgi:hypothetical protein